MVFSRFRRLVTALLRNSQFVAKQSTPCLPFNFASRIYSQPPPCRHAIMDVSSAKFPSLVLRLLQEVADSHLVTVDFEFSGVAGHRPQGSGKLTLQEYYEDTKEAAEKYQVLQVGLTIVEEDLDHARYVVRPYNFNLSPLPALRERVFSRDWSANSGGRYSFTRHSTC
jgi:hypothetical protein